VEFNVAYQYYEIHVAAEIFILRSLDCFQEKCASTSISALRSRKPAESRKTSEARATSASTILTI